LSLANFDFDDELDLVENEPDDQDFGWDMDPLTELLEFRDFVQEIIRALLRLSITISNPAPRDRYLKSSSLVVSHFEAWDLQHVQSKIPDAPSYLQRRFGKALTMRRQFLKYSKNHRARLKAGLTEDDNGDYQSTIASALPSANNTRTRPADMVSQTSYATTAATANKLTVPPLPESATFGEEFECPLCYCIVSVQSWEQWK
jgi:hypothetical protein